MERKTITLVKGDDWQGLYINGQVVLQNHSLNNQDVLAAIGVKVDVVYANLDWLANEGQLPDKLEDVVTEE